MIFIYCQGYFNPFSHISPADSDAPPDPSAANHPPCAIPIWVLLRPSQAPVLFPGSAFPRQTQSSQPPRLAKRSPPPDLPCPLRSSPTHGSCQSAAETLPPSASPSDTPSGPSERSHSIPRIVRSPRESIYL